MDIKKLKEEIHKESYISDPRSLIDVIDVDTLIDIIEELQAKNNEALDLVSGCYYLVKLMSDDEFEPALVVFIESENTNCFQFSNGVTVLCDSVNGYKEINYR